jgi:hypothetical protein
MLDFETRAADPPDPPTDARIYSFGVERRRVRQLLQALEVPVVAVHGGHAGKARRYEGGDIF